MSCHFPSEATKIEMSSTKLRLMFGKYEDLATLVGFKPGAHRWELTALITALVELLLN